VIHSNYTIDKEIVIGASDCTRSDITCLTERRRANDNTGRRIH